MCEDVYKKFDTLSKEAPDHHIEKLKQTVEDCKESVEEIDFAIVEAMKKINEVKEMRKRTSGCQSWRYGMKSTGVEKLRKGSNLRDSLKSVGERTVFH